MKRTIIATVLIFSAYTAASSKELAICGASEGYAYFPEVGLLAGNNEAGKWTDDKISDGKLTLNLNSDNKIDLLYVNATGSVRSALQDGATIVVLNSTDHSMTVLVSYPQQFIESYSFFHEASGKELVVFTTHRFNTPIEKIGIYKADCSYLAF